MNAILGKCRHVPGWVKPFLAAVTNGYNHKNAANMAGIGTPTVDQKLASDPLFKAQHDKAVAVAKPRYGHGAY